jgi:gamma-tubulin complex component 5
MALYFSDCFVTFAGAGNTHDISRQSITPIKTHRSRRLKRQRKNVIGFSSIQPLPSVDSSDTDTDTDEELAPNPIEPEYSLASNNSFEEESLNIRLDKMSSELDALVRFVRRGIEGLAESTSGTASVFNVFSFALEDWDQ